MVSARSGNNQFTVLQLGGSLEAFAIAEVLAEQENLRLITSFAGRTKRRRAIAGEDRTGHFGGIEGLIQYCQREHIGAVLDATHPFAQQMKAHAAAAAKALGLPIIHHYRPKWQAETGDQWLPAQSAEEAARIAPPTSRTCLLTLGRQEIGPFAARADLDLLIRVIDPPECGFPHPKHRFLAARGPFNLADEKALLAREKIGLVVSKNSGGNAARAKLQAAREAGIPVVMIARPPLPEGARFETVGEAAAWVNAIRGVS